MLRDSLPSITTITFFAGPDPSDAIRAKVECILRVNPWLAGTLRKVKGKLCLVYNEAEAAGEKSHFEHFERFSSSLNITQGTPLADSTRTLIEANAIARNDHALFKVSVVPDAVDDSKFALVVSMSHVIADGHTFYAIYAMLGEGSAVRPLNAKRKFCISDQIQATMREDCAWLSSPGFILGVLWAMATRRWRTKAQLSMFYIDEAWVAKQKAAAQHAGADFVSTNDVVTSWAMRASGADVGMMAINFRNRIEGCLDSDAGNYETVILYCEHDYATPHLIRRSLGNNFRRVNQPERPMPGFKQSLLGTCFIVSNWSAFDQDVKLRGCTHIFHTPLGNLGDGMPPNVRVAIVFRPAPGKLAVFVSGPSASDMGGMVACKATLNL